MLPSCHSKIILSCVHLPTFSPYIYSGEYLLQLQTSMGTQQSQLVSFAPLKMVRNSSVSIMSRVCLPTKQRDEHACERESHFEWERARIFCYMGQDPHPRAVVTGALTKILENTPIRPIVPEINRCRSTNTISLMSAGPMAIAWLEYKGQANCSCTCRVVLNSKWQRVVKQLECYTSIAPLHSVAGVHDKQWISLLDFFSHCAHSNILEMRQKWHSSKPQSPALSSVIVYQRF